LFTKAERQIMRIVAIDQGTTSTRVLVADTAGRAEVVHSLRHAVTYPQPGRVEQEAGELLANIRLALAAAGPVDAIGLANQGESCLAWDAASGEALSPVIVWQDTRTGPALAEMARQGVAGEVAARSGLPLDPYFSAAKLAWIIRSVPAAAAALKAGRLRLGTTDAYFLDRLAGAFATDRATASRTGLMNLATGEWDPELCRMFGVPIDCLPEIRANTAGFGRIGGTPVAAAIVDQQAALYGHGCRHPGEAKITFGTGAFALAVTGTTPPLAALAAGLVPTVAWDLGDGPVYAIDGGVQDAGSAIEWAVRAGLADDMADFTHFAAPPAVERGLVFVPAFSGLGCPHWDRSASPLILGLQPDMTRTDIRQALLEGIAFLTADILAAITAHAPLAAEISIDGGVSRSPYFAQFLADCSGMAIRVRGFAERTAFGAAALAARALGVELPEPADDGVLHTPSAIGAEAWRATFARAQERCLGWRNTR
jgi:glycerol kinase